MVMTQDPLVDSIGFCSDSLSWPWQVSAAAAAAACVSGAHRFAVCQQLANVVANESADGDFTGAAHAPAPAIAGLEDFQGQLQALRHHPVPLLLALVLGQAG